MGVGTKPVQGLLGVVFLGAGLQKLIGTDAMVDDFARYRYPQWLRVATGAIEVAAAAMVAGLSRPALVPVGGLLLAATMAGAVATHVRLGDPRSVIARPAVLFTLATMVVVANAGRHGEASDERRGTA